MEETAASGGHSLSITTLNVMETVTDKNGYFYFAAWGPVTVKPELSPSSEIEVRDTRVYFLKEGYAPGHVFYKQLGEKTVPLLKVQHFPEEYFLTMGKRRVKPKYRTSLSTINRHITDMVYQEDICQWKKFPKMLAEVFRIGRKARENRTPYPAITESSYLIIDIDRFTKRCGDPRAFLKEYL